MADHSITHTCGHTVIHDIGINRSRLIRHLAGRPCSNCQNAETEAKNTELTRENQRLENEIEAARESISAIGLPPLVGSLKQVAWAEQIRATAFRHSRSSIPHELPQTVELSVIHQISGMVSAKWWIENRNSASLYVRNAWESARKQNESPI